MNIHEYQAKEILREFGAPVTEGIVLTENDEIEEKISLIKGEKLIVKAQIHAGGRGKAGGVKLVKRSEIIKEAKLMLSKTLFTNQTGPNGKKVKKIYIQKAYDIEKELYLSCLVDRETSKIAFISSTEGGMDIEKVAEQNPEKIITQKFDIKDNLDDRDIDKVIKVFSFPEKEKNVAKKLIQAMYNILISKDASLIEINPLVITKDKKIICLDAKINFDDNALYRNKDIIEFRDLSEEIPAEVEASKYNLNYIKLDGNVGCMVNGAGLAMATMDIIKLHGGEPANFLDVGGVANAETVANGFKIILEDHNVKAVLINIFGGIVRCDRVAQGVIDAMEHINVNIPVIVRLEGTNAIKARELLENSSLNFIVASSLADAAEKSVKATKGEE